MTAGRSDLVEICVVLHHRSGRALLVSETGDRTRAVWLPLSQIELAPGEQGCIAVTMPEWLAHEKGLI